ncbi:cora-like Mg2+ transporter protein-domain-containing protein [Phyllosticta capitalensis]
MRITTDQAHCDEEEFMRKFNSPSCFGFPGYKSRGDGSKIFKIAKRRNMDCLLLPQTTLVIVNGFKNETLQSFVANVRRVNLLTGPGKPLHEFLRLDFCRTILHNERMVLGYLEEALRTIDFDLGGKGNHKEWSLWQSLLGFYRPHLHSSHAVKRRLYRTIKITIQEARPDENTQALEKNFQALKVDCAEFATHLEDVLRHVESTSNALTGSLSIMESRKAIKEAEEVTKLTQLAFFFIPLTFVAGIFGMNFKEMADLSIWIWAVTSVVLLLASYFVLFTSEIRGVIERSKNMIAVVEGLMLARALRN